MGSISFPVIEKKKRFVIKDEMRKKMESPILFIEMVRE